MRWFSFLFRKQVLDRQLDKELRFHLEQQISDHVASGMSPEEARRKARLDFGGLDQIKEDCRDVRPVHWLEDVVRDLRFGVAVLRRSPGMTAMAVLTLGLALGISAIMFSIIDGVLLKPLPYADADRLVRIQNRGTKDSAFLDCVRQSHSLDTLVGVQQDRSAVLTGRGFPERIDVLQVTNGFFDIFGSQLILGRGLLWPGSNPVGRRMFRLVRARPARIEQIQIIGLVGDHRFWEAPPEPTLLLPKSQGELFSPELLVRTRGNPLDLVPQMRKALQTIDSDAPLGEVISVEQWLYDGGAFRRFSMLLISIFAGLAFIVATMGIYSTIAHSVSRRTHEIGVRMAMGAQRRDVIRLILKQGIGMLLIGEAIGLSGASAANRILSRMFFGLFGDTSADKATYIVVSSLLAVIAILASYVPARKATAIDPLKALRCD